MPDLLSYEQLLSQFNGAMQTIHELRERLDAVTALQKTMMEFATTRPSPQQTRQKSAREMVEHFACELAAVLTGEARP